MCGADPYADDLKRFAVAVPVVTYAINDRSADVHAEKVVMGIWESEITVRTPIGHLRIITPLIGRNNVYNVLAAVATGLSINVPLKVRHSSHYSNFGMPGTTFLCIFFSLCAFCDCRKAISCAHNRVSHVPNQSCQACMRMCSWSVVGDIDATCE